MSEDRKKKHPRWGGPRERERCLREAQRFLPGAEAEDVVQEALLRAWRKQDAWIPPHGPLPWLLAITRNEALRMLSRSPHAVPEPVGEPPDAVVDDPELERLPLQMAVRDAIATLPDADRTLLEMRYEQDLTQGAVARKLGVPEGTVKIRLHRARSRLRAALGEAMGLEEPA